MFETITYSNHRLQGKYCKNALGSLAHPAKGLKPVKQVLAKKHVNPIVVVKFKLAFLNMLHPVTACIPQLRREALLYLIIRSCGSQSTWSFKTADVFL